MTVSEMFGKEIRMQRRMCVMDLRTLCIKEDWCDMMDIYDYDELLAFTFSPDITDNQLFKMANLIQMRTDRYRTEWDADNEESDYDFTYIFSQLCRICTYRIAE